MPCELRVRLVLTDSGMSDEGEEPRNTGDECPDDAERIELFLLVYHVLDK